MFKSTLKRILRKTGYQVVRIPSGHKKQALAQAADHSKNREFAKLIEADPLSADLHLQYALAASEHGQAFLAYAELKTAAFLGADREEVGKNLPLLRRALPDLQYINHNRYFRFTTLANEIYARNGNEAVSVLDVGGGQGQLAAFLPDSYEYCLVEPTVNGISGAKLPFPDHAFDYVLACHVLEHIPVDERRRFLDQMLAKSKRGIIILNPFEGKGTNDSEGLELIVKIIGAEWAKEHLDCSLPKVSDIYGFAADRGLEISVRPNGTVTTTMALVFVDYFAHKSGKILEWEKFNAFFNENYADILDSAEHPTAHLVYLGFP